MQPPSNINEATEPAQKDSSGPGKWKTTDTDYDGTKNVLTMIANRVTTMGEQGRVLGSDGKNYRNTTRVMTQTWVPLDENDQHMAENSAVFEFGQTKTITQRYLQGEDVWQVTGQSWHWQPVIPNTAYETKDN